MCGIIAYLGEKEAHPFLISGLRLLEYRGYDSTGFAIVNPSGLKVLKKKGRLMDLERAMGDRSFSGNLGISHTRWATHGKPNDVNAHPHTDTHHSLAIVHNGVIENFQTLRDRLTKTGCKLKSQTDTEVLAHLVAFHYESLSCLKGIPRFQKAVKQTLNEVQGTFGIAVIHKNHPDVLIGARRGSPLVLGVSENGYFLTSDVTAIAAHVEKVVYLQDEDVVIIEPKSFKIKSLQGVSRDYTLDEVESSSQKSSKKNFPHYMLKEIYEQPATIANAFRGRINQEDSTTKLGGLNLSSKDFLEIKRITILACGSARHSGLIGEYLIESLAGIPTEVDFASEFRYRNSPMRSKNLVIVVSQSGETADTLAALREAKSKGFRVLGISNRVGSSIARETQGGIFMHAGPEIGVAATKSFTSQVLVFLLLAIRLGRLANLSAAQGQLLINEITELPSKISALLKQNTKIKKIAQKYSKSRTMLFMGRQCQFPVALEGALKMKEISYIHAEGHPSAELKHGIIALIDSKVPSVFICPKDSIYDKNVSNIEEVRARSGKVIAIATEGDKKISRRANDVIYVPDASEAISPILTSIALQLFSYHTAVALKRDVDKPRNLAKSVTVE